MRPQQQRKAAPAAASSRRRRCVVAAAAGGAAGQGGNGPSSAAAAAPPSPAPTLVTVPPSPKPFVGLPGDTHAKIMDCVRFVRARAPSIVPQLAVVLGSGLGGVADDVEGAVSVPYAEIPHFHAPGVAGHPGRLVLGHLRGVPALVLQGRFHFYEGHPMVRARCLRWLLACHFAGQRGSSCSAGSALPTATKTKQNHQTLTLNPNPNKIQGRGHPADPRGQVPRLHRRRHHQRGRRAQPRVRAGRHPAYW
jgi:hypothetical protein